MTRSGRLSAEKLQLGYGGKGVADDVTLSIPDGQLTVVIGPNGCDKSTLLKGFGRLLTPMRGQVRLDSQRQRVWIAMALAARYATYLVAMHHGSIVAEGPPGEVLTESLLADAFNLTARVRRDEETDFPIVLPLHHRLCPLSSHQILTYPPSGPES